MTKNTSILLIEDNPGDVKLIQTYLLDAAFKTDLVHAETFMEAVDILSMRDDVECVLLDLTLPDSAGFRTLSKLLEKVSSVPIIVLTGINNEIVGNQAVKAGAQDFLVKGQFDGKILGRSIRYALQRFKTQQRLEEVTKQLVINERRVVEAHDMAQFGNFEMDIFSNQMTWTDSVFRIFGFQPGSFQPSLTEYMNYVHADDRHAVELFFDKAINESKQIKIEHRIVLEGHLTRHISMSTKVVYEEATQRFVLVGGIQDITERKVFEQQLVEKSSNTKQTSLRDEVLADMSFHIRTPLSTVINLLYLISNTNISPQQRELVEDIKTSVDDLSIVINNLLNFFVIVSENFKLEEEEFQPAELIQGIRKVISIKSEASPVKVEFKATNDLPDKTLGDAKKIMQILYNIVEHILTDDTERRVKIDFAAEQNPTTKTSQLMIRLTDTSKLRYDLPSNIGSTERLLELFRNEQPDNTSRQHLGLVVVMRLVQLLGGQYITQYRPNNGSTLEISLPIKAIYNMNPIIAGAKPSQPLRILLVEDHFLNQLATKRLLTSWSEFVTVDIAENGLIGVEKFRAHTYDLVLMDIQMPVMNGMDATVRIRETSKTVPIIALTANSSRTEADKCKTLGMNDYMSKPFKPQELFERIMISLTAPQN